ncbi:flagellar motor protein [Calditrichota bacterium GD2]
MRPEFLKQSEIFAFLAAIFLISIIFMAKKEQENPPIIILSEKEKSFRFDLGSANIPTAFNNALWNQIIPFLDSLSRVYECDAIEVIGHTDGVPINSWTSNLDQNLITYFKNCNVENLSPGSNVDLGMMRALAIIQIFIKSQQKGFLKKIKYFFPYSAGQMIGVNRSLITKDAFDPDKGRRRIEIALFKSATRKLNLFK